MLWYAAFKESESSIVQLQVINIDNKTQDIDVLTEDKEFAERWGFMYKKPYYINSINLKDVGAIYYSENGKDLTKSTRPKLLSDFEKPNIEYFDYAKEKLRKQEEVRMMESIKSDPVEPCAIQGNDQASDKDSEMIEASSEGLTIC